MYPVYNKTIYINYSMYLKSRVFLIIVIEGVLSNILTDEQELGWPTDEANFYTLTVLKFGGMWTNTYQPQEEQTSMPWHAWSFVDCGLIQVDLTMNKCISLDRLDVWWIVDWYGGPYHVDSPMHWLFNMYNSAWSFWSHELNL